MDFAEEPAQPASRAMPGGGGMFGADMDLDEGDDVQPLELDGERSRHSAPALARQAAEAQAPPEAGRGSLPAPVALAAPVDPEVLAGAQQLAAHGQCTSALQAPGYALRVRKRLAALRAEVKRLEEALILAQAEAEESLARIAQCIRDPATFDQQLAPHIEAIVRAEAQAKDRELAVIAADTSSAVLSDVVKQRIQQVRTSIAPAQEELQSLAPDLRAKQEAQRRVLAQVRRSEIELRNLKDLANAKETEASAQTDPARKSSLITQSAELRGRSPEYESVLASHRATAAEMQGPISDLERQMAQLRRQIADGEGEIHKLQAGQQKEAAALDRAKEERMLILDAARVTVRSRMAEMARAAIATGFMAESIAPMIPESEVLQKKAGAVRRQLAIYNAALEVHDKSRVQQGYMILFGAGALVFALLIALAKLL